MNIIIDGLEDKEDVKYWWKRGRLHREDGPAAVWKSGHKSWYLNGLLHREEGPAIERPDGDHVYYLNNKMCSKEEHAKLIRLKAFW